MPTTAMTKAELIDYLADLADNTELFIAINGDAVPIIRDMIWVRKPPPQPILFRHADRQSN